MTLKPLALGNAQLDFSKRSYLMGVLNVTPDSFSDGGAFIDPNKALDHALAMQEAGADIIDLGGESTRTKYAYGKNVNSTSEEDELARVVPVLEALEGRLATPISIDTYKASVARRAVELGASMVNDVWGFSKDAAMADTVAELGVPVVLMHNADSLEYEGDLIDAISAFFDKVIHKALSAGIKKENIVLDPGACFGKRLESSIELMQRLGELCSRYSDFPFLLGVSRKSMLRSITGRDAMSCAAATAASTAFAITQGVNILRVHDVAENLDAVKITDTFSRRLNAWVK